VPWYLACPGRWPDHGKVAPTGARGEEVPMTDEPEHRPRLRVGGWIPAYREKAGRMTDDDEGPDRLVTTPLDGSGSLIDDDGPEPGRRRRVLLVAALVAAIVLTAGGVATVVNHGSSAPDSAALVTDPVAPAASAPAAPIASPSASGQGGASAGADVERTDKARPASSKPSPSATPASSKPTTAAAHPLAPGSVISLEPTDLPGSRLRHSDALAWVDPISASSSALDRADARWIVHAGLADSSCVSFESSNYPGQYLRHQNSRLRRDPPDGSDLFKSDATFCPETAGSAYVVRFRSSNYPTRYLNRQDTAMYLADAGVAGETFTVRPPL
jgi:hypothetical protein